MAQNTHLCAGVTQITQGRVRGSLGSGRAELGGEETEAFRAEFVQES